MRKSVVAMAVIGILAGASAPAAAPDGAGPPPFVSYPILVKVGEDGADHGHFIFGPGESLVPAPLAPHLGTASYQPAPPSGFAAPTAGTDTDISSAPNSYEGETGAVSNGTVILGGSNHIFPGACSTTASGDIAGDCFPYAYASTDGATWTRSILPRTWSGTTFGIGFDPGIDVDKNGTFYYSYGMAPLSGTYPNAIVVAKSSNGTSWTQATPVTFNKRSYFDDKYYIAIDRSNSSFANRIYVAWDRNQANNQILYVVYSSNGGATWTAPIKVDDGKTKFERVIGAYPAVDQATGKVYLSWHNYAKNIIYVDKSTNGGAAWGTDVAAATTHAGFGTDIGCVGGRSQGPAHALKVGPSGALYLVYADPVANRGFDILLTKSTDGGTSWSTPRTVNDDAGAKDQFHPTLSVESNGSGGDKVTVTFYDRRDDSANCSAHVYATQSTDSGATWAANIRLTSASSNFNGNPNGPGDYSSSTPAGGKVYPYFSDHRTSDFDVRSATVN
jgi:hypothetical protein